LVINPWCDAVIFQLLNKLIGYLAIGTGVGNADVFRNLVAWLVGSIQELIFPSWFHRCGRRRDCRLGLRYARIGALDGAAKAPR
jgi:hypothetical protein